MEGYDIIMLCVIVVATVYGAHKGLAWQVASIASILVSYGAAYRFRGQVAEMINAEAPWNMFLAMLVLYVGTSLGIWLLFRVLNDFIERLKLKEFDRQMGALLGFAKGAILCTVITLFAVTLLGDTQRRAIVRARSGHYIARILNNADPIMPAEIKDVLDPYLDNLERRLEAEGDVPDSDWRRDPEMENDSADDAENAVGEVLDSVFERVQTTGRRRILNELPRWSDR
jgi:membrane protein required for colicin V production